METNGTYPETMTTNGKQTRINTGKPETSCDSDPFFQDTDE